MELLDEPELLIPPEPPPPPVAPVLAVPASGAGVPRAHENENATTSTPKAPPRGAVLIMAIR
jgi:hypothetical protein